VNAIPRAQIPQPAEEALALTSSPNNASGGKLIQIAIAQRDGFLVASFDEG
jgi:hypothetical protein